MPITLRMCLFTDYDQVQFFAAIHSLCRNSCAKFLCKTLLEIIDFLIGSFANPKSAYLGRLSPNKCEPLNGYWLLVPSEKGDGVGG